MDDWEQGSRAMQALVMNPGCDQARGVPVLVWIKDEEPSDKACHTVGKSKAQLGLGLKRQCWHYTKQNATAQKNWVLGVVRVVF